jgi:hypothetical protein
MEPIFNSEKIATQRLNEMLSTAIRQRQLIQIKKIAGSAVSGATKAAEDKSLGINP